MDLPVEGLTLPPVITTERLVLRPLMADDPGDLVQGVGDLEVSRWLSPVPHPYTEDLGRDVLALASRRAGLWVVEEDGAFLGVVEIGDELGFWLRREAWGRGLMTEAARAAAHAWFAAGHWVLLSGHFDGNRGSRRVLTKLGFADAGPKTFFCAAQDREGPGRLMRLEGPPP